MSRISTTSLAPRDTRGRMSDELIAALKQRVASNYYFRPEVDKIIACAVTDEMRGVGCRVRGITAFKKLDGQES